MSSGRALFVTLLYSGAIYALLYGVMLLPIYAITSEAASVYTTQAMVIPFFAAFAFRRYIKTLILFLLAHAVLLGTVICLAGGPTYQFCYGAYTLLICLYSVVKRIKNEEEDVGTGFMLTSLFILTGIRLMAGYLGYEPLYPVYPVLAGFIIIASLVCIHITSIDSSLKLITQTPVKQILSFNNKIMAGFVVLLVVMALGSRYSHIDDAIRLLGSLLFVLLRALAGLLRVEEDGEAVLEEAAGGGFDYNALFGDEAKATPAILVILDTILRYLILFGMIVLAVVGIGYGCYRIYKKFYETGSATGEDEKTFIAPVLEVNGILMNRLKDILPMFGVSPKERVRRIFYKTVNKHIVKGVEVLPSDTAGEIASKMRQAENIDELEKQYEEARYGS